ncbi:MAG: tetratricopeptide repeat protein [Bacteroidales bacterium]|nr:tetratricopeptide repeat protein [Bacteroidales bacterium]
MFIFSMFPSFGQQLEAVPLSPADTFAIYKNRQKAIELNGTDLKEESRCYDQIAYIYWEHNRFAEAAEWYKKSIAVNRQLNNQSGIAMINSNLGLLYSDMHEYEMAVEYFRQTLAYRKMIKDRVGIVSSLINMSIVLNNLSRYDESIAALDEALSLAREMNDIKQMQSCYGMLSETYEKAKQPEKAHYYFEYYRSFHEMVQEEKEKVAKEKVSQAELQVKLLEMEKQNQELQLKLATRELIDKEEELSVSQHENVSLYKRYTKAELERSLLEKDNLLKQRDLESQLAEQKRQQLGIVFLSVILVFFGVALIVYIRLYKQKNKMNRRLIEQNDLIVQQKREIEVQKTDLTDSINYALLIQNAALKKSMAANLRSVIDDFFIFFNSKAIVSGDFYWFSLTSDKLVLVTADCTGHGVPGAFMSLIGMNLLERIVEDNEIYMPDEILIKLNNAIKETLDQNHNKSFDGMDAAICTLDFSCRKMYFAGAYRPMLIYRDHQLTLVKGNTCSLGGSQEYFEKKAHFTLKTFDLTSAAKIYLFSDGFYDQINEQSKKIGSKRFYELIGQVASQPMNEQYSAIRSFFENWKGNSEQVDDVLVAGFSLKP